VNIKATLPFFALLLTAALTSCSQSETTSSESSSAENYYTGITIREIMASLIDPPADALWNSIRVVSDSNGITEYYPETDEEWSALRASAVSIIEGSNSLMMPGRRVAPPGAEGEFPEYEFTPEEVEEVLAEDPDSWVVFSRTLQDAGLKMLDAVDARDAELLSEYGALLDEACESCHAAYWYRAGI